MARGGGRGQDRTRAARGGGRGQDRTRAAHGGGREQDRTRALTRCLYSRTGTNKLLREEGKKERSGRRLLLRISVARSASLHIPSSRSASLHIPSSRIPDGAKGRGLVAGTHRDTAVSGHFPSGRSRVRASSFRTQPCQGKWRPEDACHGTTVTLAVKTRNIAANTLLAFASTQRVPGIVTQSSSILYI